MDPKTNRPTQGTHYKSKVIKGGGKIYLFIIVTDIEAVKPFGAERNWSYPNIFVWGADATFVHIIEKLFLVQYQP